MAARDVEQHRSVTDRVAAAHAFLAEGIGGGSGRARQQLPLCLPLFADGEGSPFNAAYASWPFRFWVLLPGGSGGPVVGFKAMPQNAAYDLNDLEVWLNNYQIEQQLSNSSHEAKDGQ